MREEIILRPERQRNSAFVRDRERREPLAHGALTQRHVHRRRGNAVAHVVVLWIWSRDDL